MKTSRQVKDLINNLSKKKGVANQALFTSYMMERLLERISLSKYKDNFILKGGMLVAALIGVDMRSTMDMDATLKGYPLSEEDIEKAFRSILSVEVDDGVEMTIKSINSTRDEDEYGGLRISFDAKMDKMKIPFKVDITTGDKITPKEVRFKMPLLLEDREIEVWSYNIETVLAEKLETVARRGITNTRTRDFYDIYILMKLYSEDIDFELLKEAVVSTAKRRESEKMLLAGRATLEVVFLDDKMARAWTSYREKYKYAELIEWTEVREEVYKSWDRLFDNY